MATDTPAAASGPETTPAAPTQPQVQSQPQPQLPPRSSQYAQYPGAYGQPFQPYPQYGASPDASGGPRWSTLQQQLPPGAQVIEPPPVAESKKWVISKMVLHGFGFIFGVVILALGLTFINDWYWSAIMLIMNCTLAVISILWSGIELIARASHSLRRGVHPGAHVGITLIIWLCAAVVGGFATAITIYSPYDYYDYSGSGSSCSRWSSDSDDCAPTGRNAILIASTLFTWFQWLVYFILFVLACIDTSRLNSAKRRPIMVVQQAPWMQGAPHQSVQLQQQPHMSQQRGSYYPPVGGVYPPPAAARQSMPPQPVPTASGAMPPPQQQDVAGPSSAPAHKEYYAPNN